MLFSSKVKSHNSNEIFFFFLMGKKIKKIRNRVFLFYMLTKSTEVTQHLGQVTQVLPVYCRCWCCIVYRFRRDWCCIVSYIGFGMVKLETDTTQPSRIGIGRFFQPCQQRKTTSNHMAETSLRFTEMQRRHSHLQGEKPGRARHAPKR